MRCFIALELLGRASSERVERELAAEAGEQVGEGGGFAEEGVDGRQTGGHEGKTGFDH